METKQGIRIMAERARRGGGGRRSSHTFLTEEHADGFVSDEPNWIAYCPDCDAKVSLLEHEECPYFGGEEKDEKGNLIAFRCALFRRS